MSRRSKKSSAAVESASPEPQQDDANAVPPVTDAASGPAGSQMSAGDHTEEESGDAASEAPAELVKPLTGSEPTEATVVKAITPTCVDMPPEVEASASGINSSPSQGAADDDEAMAGPVHGLVIATGAENVEQLLRYADIGKRLSDLFAPRDPYEWLSSCETFVGVDMARPGSDITTTSLATASEDGRIAFSNGIRVKAKRDGWRRAGIVHSKAGRDFGPDELTPQQVRLIMNDPNLTVELL